MEDHDFRIEFLGQGHGVAKGVRRILRKIRRIKDFLDNWYHLLLPLFLFFLQRTIQKGKPD
jgi:hypothetical protein